MGIFVSNLDDHTVSGSVLPMWIARRKTSELRGRPDTYFFAPQERLIRYRSSSHSGADLSGTDLPVPPVVVVERNRIIGKVIRASSLRNLVFRRPQAPVGLGLFFSMSRVVFFVDGFNVYHAIEANPAYRKYKWLDLDKLCRSLTRRADQSDSSFNA